MRVPSGRSPLLAVLFLAGGAFGQAPAQDKKEDELKEEKAKRTEAADRQSVPPSVEEPAITDSDPLVPVDSLAWQTLSDDLFTPGERGLEDPGRLAPEPRNILKLGPVQLLPRFDEELVYDDNVFLTEDDRKQDFILRTGLGVLADYSFGGGAHHLSAGYDMTRNWFLGGESKNFVEQTASAQLDLGFQRLHVTVGDRYEDRTDPILAVFTGKIERTINTAHGTVNWHEETWYAEVKAQRATTSYADSAFEGFDRDEDFAHLEVGVLDREDLWGFARLGFIDRVFDQDVLNDMQGIVASVGIRASRDDAFEVMARVGVRAESFDDEAPTDADDQALNADAEVALLVRPIRSGALDLHLVRTTEFSPISNYEILDRAELSWMQQLDDRLTGRTGVGFEHVDPSNTSPSFSRYVIGAGLRYALLSNADLTLNWRLRLRATKVADGDYTGNQVILGFAIRL